MMKLSIITVSYNEEDNIERAIQSVLSQEVNDIEYILIDGGSTDATTKIIKKYEDSIDYWISESDSGIYDAMNKGLSHATGDIVAFLNCDDWYEKNALKLVCKYFEDNHYIDILWGRAYLIKNGERIGIFDTNIKEYYRQMPGCHQALFAKRELFTEIGNFNTKYKITADFDWFLRCYFANKSILTIKELLVNYCTEGTSAVYERDARKEEYEIAHNQAKEQKDGDLLEKVEHVHFENQMAFKYEDLLREIKEKSVIPIRDKGYYLWGIGDFGKKAKDLLEVTEMPIKGFINKSTEITSIFGYPIYAPYEINKNSNIIISSVKFQEEILNEAMQYGFQRNNIMLFQNLMCLINEIYRLDIM